MTLNNASEAVRVLLVDDDEDDYIIIKRLFTSMKGIKSQLEWVSSSTEAIARIKAEEHDAYLIDYRIDARTGLDVLQEADAFQRIEPFILLTGVGDQGIERESLHLAASDYLVKKDLTSDALARTIYYALGRKEQEKQKINQLIEINKAKDEFISIASHQLRTPATTVKQYVAMVLDGLSGNVSETQKKFLLKAYESNERQLSIINNLLKVAQVDSGSFELALNRSDVAHIVQEAAEDFAPAYSQKKQTLITDNFKATHCLIDENAIRMVIDNLLENASKYSTANTTTTISMTHSKSSVKIIISDEGVGVLDPTRLFKKFSRIENELSTVVGGTGIGLYWAQSIARLHGGDLFYEVNSPHGSKFILLLPIVK